MRLLSKHFRSAGSKTLLGRIVGRRERCKPGTTQTLSRFSGEARAQTEARALDHNYVGTEHIVQALWQPRAARRPGSWPRRGVGVERTRAALAKRFVGRGPAPPPPGPLLLTPRSKQTLGLAVREAKADRGLHAGTEHLLLALARVTDGLAAEVLREVGLDEPAIRKRIPRAGCRCSSCERRHRGRAPRRRAGCAHLRRVRGDVPRDPRARGPSPWDCVS